MALAEGAVWHVTARPAILAFARAVTAGLLSDIHERAILPLTSLCYCCYCCRWRALATLAS